MHISAPASAKKISDEGPIIEVKPMDFSPGRIGKLKGYLWTDKVEL